MEEIPWPLSFSFAIFTVPVMEVIKMLWLISANTLLALVKIILLPFLAIETIVSPFLAIILDVLEIFNIDIFPKRFEQYANRRYKEVFGDKVVKRRINRIPRVTCYAWKGFITEWITF